MAVIWWWLCYLLIISDTPLHPGVCVAEASAVPMPSVPPPTQETVDTQGVGGGTPGCPAGCLCGLPTSGEAGGHGGVFTSGHRNVVACHFPFLHQGIDLRFPNVKDIQVLNIICDTDLVLSRMRRGLFSHLPHLDTLQIRGCRLLSLHNHTFVGLNNLTTLLINHAGLEDVTDAGWLNALGNLKSLDLSMNEIRVIPGDMFCNKGLENLNLSANGLWNTSYLGLKPKDESGVCGREMVAVDLSYSYIMFFDLELMRSFPNLKGMILRFSGIHTLYPVVFRNMASLLEIDLTGNHLKRIGSQTLGVLPKLRNLYLAHNLLEEIEIDISASFPSLETLNLRENNLTMISSKLASNSHGKLNWIALSKNNFNQIDQEFFHYVPVSNITVLSVTGNGIQNIADRAFQNLVNLEELYIMMNNITSIGEHTFSGLSKLKELHMGGNQIQRISNNAFMHCPLLVRLILKQNGLYGGIPQALFHLQNIRFIDLTNNYITEINPELHRTLVRPQVIRIDRRHNRWLPDWMVEKTYRQFQTMLHPFSSLTQTLLPESRHTLSHFTSYVKLSLYQNKNQSIYTDLHLLLLREITHIYFQFHGSADQQSNIILLDVAFNKIKRVGADEYDLLNLLPDNSVGDARAVTYSDVVSSLSETTSMKLGLMIQGGFQCHCRLRHIKALLDTSVLESSLHYRNPMKGDLSKEQCVNDKIKMWTLAVDEPDTKELCFTDLLCNPKTCSCCNELSCSCLQQCPPQCSCILDNRNRFTIIDCTNAGLASVTSTIPSFATHLKLDWNHFIEISTAAFPHFSYLETLYLNNSKVYTIKKDAFKGLIHLTTLYLQDNLIDEIYNWTFANLRSLSTLDLSFNKMTSIEPNSVSHLKGLRELNLNGNNLTTLDLDQLDDLPLEVITLGDNPWSCECDFVRKFRKWLIKKHDAVGDIQNISCFYEQSGSDQNATGSSSSWFSMFYTGANSNDSSRPSLGTGWVSILKGNFSHCGPEFDTISSNQSMPLAMGLLSLGFILLCITTILVFQKRLFLRVQFYSRWPNVFWNISNFLKGFIRRPVEKQFDIFMVYSPSDWDFVFHQLLPGLEEHSHLKVCTDYFNWPAAKIITNTIITSVEKSRCTLLVLSRNFFNYEWCTYSFRMAHHRSLKYMDHQVLVLLMPDMTKTFTRNLSPDLKLYLKTKACIKWKDPAFWKKIQYITKTANHKANLSEGTQNRPGTHDIIEVPDHLM